MKIIQSYTVATIVYDCTTYVYDCTTYKYYSTDDTLYIYVLGTTLFILIHRPDTIVLVSIVYMYIVVPQV